MVRGVKGALFYSILIATVVAIPMGVVSMPESWSPVSLPHSMAPVFCQFDFSAFVNPETGFFNLKMIMVIFSLLLVNILTRSAPWWRWFRKPATLLKARKRQK